jgi:predicted ferric reductase
MRASDLLVTLLWSSGAAAAAIYLAYGGIADLGTIAGVVTGIGIVTGLVGTDFILVMLVLAARVPVIDRTIGHDRAIAVHRQLGKPALYLLLAHGVFLLIGYGISSHLNPIAEIGPMLALPDMPLAFIGLGLMILVVVTSLVAVRRKFSYEGWHLVHLLSYVSVAVALPHQFSTGQVLANGTVQRVYWIALYVVAFGSVLFYRFLEPAIVSLRHQITVDNVEVIAPGVTSIHLTGRRLSQLGAAGGQFFVWRFWTGSTWWHSHPISLSAVPTGSSARITVRDLGAGTARISGVPTGTRVTLEGPYGIFTDRARTAPKMAIVAAGIGVTPVRALLEDSRIRPGETTILLRASTERDAILWDEVRQLAAIKGGTVYTSIGRRGRRGTRWLSDEDASRGVTIRSIFPDLLDSDLYVCGPTNWLDAVESDARAAGIPDHQIHSERFDW